MRLELIREQVKARVAQVVIKGDVSIQSALEPLDRAGLGILLLTDDHGQLSGVVTDGDIRRAILRHVPLTDPCLSIATTDPLVAPPDVLPADALRVMDQRNGVSHLPILSADRQILGLLLRSDLVDEEVLPVSAVVMAGGFGTRLWPLTLDVPKPLLTVGDRPVMEHLVDELRFAGIRHVHVTTHHLSDKIKDHFGDGARFGMEFRYVSEDRPLGTAGALGLMERSSEPLLVINGDILTRVDFRAMLAFHKEHAADLTVAVRQYDYEIPYGVVECEGVRVKQVREKPHLTSLVNAGIYLLEPRVYDYIESGRHLHMTDLIERLLEAGRAVISFPIIEYWLDIGQPRDYEQAQADVANGRLQR